MTNSQRAVVIVAMMATGGSALQARGAQEGASSPAGCVSAGGRIQNERFVPIGGIEHWITITGADCGNPVILFIHGGPGNTLSPYAHSLFGDWETQFTLVQWDQRGAGRTYGRNPPPEGATLTVERMAEDGVAVAEYLRTHLGQAKIILVGGSWGSILGIHMIKARPDLFEAYIGFAQVVSYRENQSASYAKAFAAARASGDQDAVAALEGLGAPPWTNPRHSGVLRRLTRRYEARTTDPPPASWWVRSPAYDTPAMRDSYGEGEDFSYLQFVGLRGDGMFSRVDLPALGHEFQVPVFIVQGAEDLVTVPAVTKRYFDGISAPAKRFVLVPRAGHDPNTPMLEAVYMILTRDVQPPLRSRARDERRRHQGASGRVRS